MTPNEIVIRIITDLAALKSGMQQATGIIGGAASAAQGLSTKLGDIEQGARRAGMQLALIGGAGVAAFGSTVKSAVDFEKNMALIVALTGVQKDEIAGLTERMKPLAIVTGITLGEMSQAFYFAASAVSDTDTAFSILEASAYGSAGGLGNLTVVVDAVSSAVNAYATSGLTAAHATDVLIQTVRDGKAEPEALAGSFGMVLPVASAMGLTFEEVGANLAIMTRVGMSADEASTTLKSTLMQFLKPSADAVALLADMGISMDDLRKSIKERGLLATLNDLIAATGGNVTELATLFPNVRALTDVLGSAVAQGDAYTQVLDNMNSSAGATTEAFNIMAGTNAMNIARLKAMLSVLSDEIGSILLPTVYELTDALQTFVSRLRELTQQHPELTKFVVLFGAVASVVALVTGGLLLFVSVVAGGLKALIDLGTFSVSAAKGIGSLAKAMAQAAIDAGTLAVKMALTAWDTLASNIGKAADNIWNFSRGMADAALHPDIKTKVQLDTALGTNQLAPAYKTGASAFEKLGLGAIQGLGISLGPAIKAAIPGILTAIGGAVAALAVGIATLLEAALSIALALAPFIAIIAAVLLAAFLIYHYRDQIWSGLTTLFDVLKEFFTEAVPKWFKENFTPEKIGYALGFAAGVLLVAMFPIPFLIIKFRGQIEGFLSAIPGLVAGIPGRIASFIGDHWYAILFALFPVEMAITRWRGQIGGFITGVAAFVAGIPDRIADFVGDHWKGILFALFPIPMAIIKWHEQIESWLGNVADFIGSIPGKIGGLIGDHWKDIISGFGFPQWTAEFTTKATSWVTEMVPKIPGLFAALGKAIANGIKDAFLSLVDFGAWLKTAFATFWDHVPGPVKSFLKGAGGGFGEVIGFFTKGAMGLQNFMGGLALVGEAGPELLRLPRGSDVIRNENIGQTLREVGGGSGGLSIPMSIAANFVDYDSFKRYILDTIAEKLDENAGRVRLAAPRAGTFGAGMARP